MNEEYNGWTNRETWAVNLWLDNDQVLNEMSLDLAKEEISGHDEGEEINPYFLGEAFKNWVENELLTRESVENSVGLWNMLTDIGSLWRVNWREIGEAWLQNAKENEAVNA